MDRLSYRDADGRARLTLFGKQMYCSTQATAECFAKLEESLAAYKDTGLEPEEVAELKERFDAHWLEIFKAEEQGRLIILPCKVGDTLYHTGRGSVEESRVAQINLELCMDSGEGISGIWWTHDYNIGKTVFFTREEAEAEVNKQAE